MKDGLVETSKAVETGSEHRMTTRSGPRGYEQETAGGGQQDRAVLWESVVHEKRLLVEDGACLGFDVEVWRVLPRASRLVQSSSQE